MLKAQKYDLLAHASRKDSSVMYISRRAFVIARAVVTAIILALFLVIGTTIGGHEGTATFAALTVVLVAWGFSKPVPKDPPHVGVASILGRRSDFQVGEGPVWLPFRPLFNILLVDYTAVNVDLEEEVAEHLLLFTGPDKTRIRAIPSFTFHPDWVTPGALRIFLNKGGTVGVTDIFVDMMIQRTREWVIDDSDRKDWFDVVGAGDDAVRQLALTMSGQDLENTHDLKEGEVKALKAAKAHIPVPSLGCVLSRVNMKLIETTDPALQETASVLAQTKIIGAAINMLVDDFSFDHDKAVNVVQTQLDSAQVGRQIIDVNLPEGIAAMLGALGLGGSDGPPGDGAVPLSLEELLKVPGVGEKTALAILAARTTDGPSE